MAEALAKLHAFNNGSNKLARSHSSSGSHKPRRRKSRRSLPSHILSQGLIFSCLFQLKHSQAIGSESEVEDTITSEPGDMDRPIDNLDSRRKSAPASQTLKEKYRNLTNGGIPTFSQADIHFVALEMNSFSNESRIVLTDVLQKS